MLAAFAIATCAAGMIALGRNDLEASIIALTASLAMCTLADRVCSKIEEGRYHDEEVL